MSIPMMTFQEQLDLYPALKKYTLKLPQVYPLFTPIMGIPIPAWRVYAQKHDGGGWAMKDFLKYKEAFIFFKNNRNKYHDMSITSKRRGYDPPGRIVKITRQGQPVMVKTPTGPHQMTKLVPIKPPADHRWCMFCRRFTTFGWFTSHHSFRGEMKLLMDPAVRRCTVCGIRESTGAFRR